MGSERMKTSSKGDHGKQPDLFEATESPLFSHAATNEGKPVLLPKRVKASLCRSDPVT